MVIIVQALNGYIVYNESTREIIVPNSTVNWGKCNEGEISNIFISYDNSENYNSIELCWINSDNVESIYFRIG